MTGYLRGAEIRALHSSLHFRLHCMLGVTTYEQMHQTGSWWERSRAVLELGLAGSGRSLHVFEGGAHLFSGICSLCV